MKKSKMEFKREIDNIIETVSEGFLNEIPITDIKVKVKIKKHRCRNFIDKIKKLINKKNQKNRTKFLAGISNNAKMVDLMKNEKKVTIKENGKSFTFKTDPKL